MVKVKTDLTGQRFGMLTVVKQAEDYVSPKGVHFPRWECECSCDEHNRVIVLQNSLKSKNGTRSCGCLSHRVLLTVNGETHNVTEWSRITGLNAKTISGRIQAGWDEDHIFDDVGTWKPATRFNEHYFDVIDDEHKAYWIGFIWADGYMAIRNRNNRTSYEFKLSLADHDYQHIEKFNNDIDGSYEIKHYECNGFAGTHKAMEARILITNQYFGKLLVNKYGIIPNRTDCSGLLSSIPGHLMKHFIRGLIDADGSFCHYVAKESNKYGTYNVQKCVVDIGGQPDLLKEIEQHLINNNIVNDFDRKIHKRHEGDEKDGSYRNLKFCGRNQAMTLLHYIYDDATIYLDRKYAKFLNIVEKLEGLNEVQAV